MDTALGIGSRVKHPAFGVGIVCGIDMSSYTIFFRDYGDKTLARDYEGLEVIEAQALPDNTLTLDDVKLAMRQVMEKIADVQEVIPLGYRWKGGKMVLYPADDDQKPKEIPIETFFHKIVMVRDRLRVMEQNINSHKVLSDEEKVHLQQYITRIYGSLTTFNVLFRNKEDFFKGDGGKG